MIITLMPIKRLSMGLFLSALVLFAHPLAANNLPDFTQLAAKHSAAVVNISTSGRSQNAPPPNIPKPFQDFFKYFEQFPPPNGGGKQQDRLSLGSGFIIAEDGYVITNHHVVKDASEIIVRLTDRREFVAELVGHDQKSDIAVLKVAATGLPTLKFSRNAELKVGEWVLAIGSPFGFDHSVTAGIVSAIGRSLPNESYIPFIQTDVAINPGNSGGPLFNLQGEVIGVNSQIYSRTGGFMGLSFAVPAAVVADVYQQLRDNGRVARGWLGVLIQDVTGELAQSFAMSHPHGALIAKVLLDSPAMAAGLEVGDIIVNFNRKPIKFSADLPPLVGSTAIGTKVPVEIIRQAKRETITVLIAELPSDEALAKGSSAGSLGNKSNPLNITVKELSAAQKKQLELDAGVMIERRTEGPAAAAGLQPGDVIIQINNIKITDSQTFNEVVAALPKQKPIPILIQRHGRPIFLALKID